MRVKAKETYTLGTGDTLSSIETITGSKLTCTIAKLRVPEMKSPVNITFNPVNNDVIIHRGWRLHDAVGEARFNAIEEALRSFFTSAPIPAAH